MLPMAVARSSSGGVTQSEGEGSDFVGFRPCKQCTVWAVQRYKFRYEWPISINLTY